MKQDIFDVNKYKYPYLNPTLPLEDRIKDLISRMTLEEKISMIPTSQGAVERLGIKKYGVGGEAAHGVVSPLGTATVFPQPQGLSCTWDSELMKDIGNVIGDEARVYYKKNNEEGGLTLWAPTIDMERDPRWGRTEEAYGEDPCLTGKLSAELIKGMQGEDDFYLKLVPAPKHFYGNNNEEGRIYCSSSIDPRNKHEYYLKAFEKAFTEGKAYSMMTAYNEINGRPCIVNPEVKTIVKKKWGCDGFIVCDGGDMSQTVEFHKYYETHAETIANAIKNGVDVMTDDRDLVIKSTKEAIDKELLCEEDLDRALDNIFKVRFRLGQFDPAELNPYSNISEKVLNCEKHKALAKKAAKEAIVLLKNENNTLPLNKNKLNNIAIIGPLADVVYRDWYTGKHEYKVTPLQGIKNMLEGCEVSYCSGNDIVKISDISGERYLKVSSEKKVSLDNIDADKADEFELADWGWESCTLKALKEERYLTTDDKEIHATAEEVFGWFVKEIIKVKEVDEDKVEIRTWNDKSIYTDEQLGLKVLEDSTNNSRCEKDKLNCLNDNFKLEKVRDGIEDAVDVAKNSDVAIVFVGNNPVINGKEEIDRTDINLPDSQEQLVKEVYKANPNTVVVVVGSYPFSINEINNNIPAIMYTAHGCQELGNAIAEVIFGQYSPAGRLSMTWYSSLKDLPPINDYDIIKGKRTYMYYDGKPLYSFGHGLTYTQFKYSDLKVSSEKLAEDEEFTLTLKVKNTGNFDSDEVVQVYIRADKPSVKRPYKELKAFKRVNIKAGQQKELEFNIKVNELAFWDVRSESYLVESGNYTIMVGSSSEDIRLQKSVEIWGKTLMRRQCKTEILAVNYDDYNDVFIDEWKECKDCVVAKSDYSYLRFNDFEFCESNKVCELVISNNKEGKIELFLDSIDGVSIGKCKVEENREFDCLKIISFDIKPYTGMHDLFIKLSSEMKIRSFIIK
ncbi:glycoside hydrolase family 3 protein [Clostridium manihotivorum]|uniref:Beta-glucosidase n=1 Tax=Clostridium manihotivorum TaxID=2320868 RepID=A0A410DVD8_9CLOT|nr:glycoside hydrolase family 3 protein [Clostridium manihotivorum]QAA33074.1 beta-glucosidase [Clostridium manihotivorum]